MVLIFNRKVKRFYAGAQRAHAAPIDRLRLESGKLVAPEPDGKQSTSANMVFSAAN